jgi:hypothetical protein
MVASRCPYRLDLRAVTISFSTSLTVSHFGSRAPQFVVAHKEGRFAERELYKLLFAIE